MKILFTSEDRVRPDSTGVYFRRAFEETLGKDNVLFMYNEDLHKAPSGLDLYVKVDDGLSTHRFPDHLHPSCYYIIDTHIDYKWRYELAGEAKFDKLYFAQNEGLKQEWHTKDKLWVPLAADRDMHYVGKREKKYDTCFVGYFHSQHAEKRIDYVHELFKHTSNFYFSQGTRFFKDMTTKLAETRLVFNKSLNDDINMRFFESMCSGSALLSDYIQDARLLGFRQDIDYIGYQNIDEMKDKATFYLKHPELREDIAESGKRFVHFNHLYKHRVAQILDSCLSGVK